MRFWTRFAGTLMLALRLSAAANDTFVLRNVTIHPVTSADIPNGAILVRDGKIVDIGKSVAAGGAKVIDGRGLHVYPGMIDACTQLGLSEVSSIRETNDTNELGDFNPQLRALIAVNPESAHFPVTRANGITSAVTIPTGGLVAGQAALIHMDGWTWEEMAVKRSIAMNMRLPALQTNAFNFNEGGPIRRPYAEVKRAYDQQLQQLDQFFENARRYQKAKAAGGSGFRTDLKFEAMLPVLEGKLPVLMPAPREREIHDALAFADRNKVKIVLVDLAKPGKALDDIKKHNVSVILGPTLELPPDEDDAYDAASSLPGEIFRAGIKFAFATNQTSGGPGSVQFARNLPYQAANAVAFGLPQEEALKAVTINAAEIYGVADQVGSIEKGKVADLVVTDGDLLETRTNIKRLFIAGKEVNLTNKHLELYEKYKARP